MTMRRTLTIILLTLTFAPGAAVADSWKDERGQGRGQTKKFRKQQEKHQEQREKAFEKRQKHVEKLREKERKRQEKAWEKQEKRRERYWKDLEKRRERTAERAGEWRNRHTPYDRPLPQRTYPEPYGWYEDYESAPYPYESPYHEEPYYEEPYYEEPYYEEPRRFPTPPPSYDMPHRPYDLPQRHDDRVEGVYTPFGYYEEYRPHPYRDYEPRPEAHGRIGPYRFEIWEE